jgi:hypothetical protein
MVNKEKKQVLWWGRMVWIKYRGHYIGSSVFNIIYIDTL